MTERPCFPHPFFFFFFPLSLLNVMLQVGQNIFQSFSRDADAELDWKAAVDSW